MNHYRELIVWQKSKVLVLAIYNLTKSYPKDEAYGLTSQMRRAAISIPSNIAEGSGRRSTSEFLQFLYITRGSLFELATQMEISHDLSLIDLNQMNQAYAQINEIERMLNALISKLRTKTK